MTDPGHQKLRRLFERALELAKSEREAFLREECSGDARLKARVEALLCAAEDERFLSTPTGAAPTAVPTTDVAPLKEGPGTRIGPYKLLEEIGEGGFGIVFMAEQEKPVTRRVALKIIKLGMDTRQVVARFEQERQALALMEHPNIARVIDAGATETGRPYFVMELVKGDPIVEYCDEHQLPIDERLALFEQVCHAVQHAHSKGIIHRDLKPSNILVATQDGKPLAKIIDFGIAKATSAKLTDKTLFTEHRQIIGTFQYMSPEQAEGSLDIDTRTDVYALGVVLYELLTGSTPFDADTLEGAMQTEIQRMIREVEPPKPSTRLHRSAQLLASIAAQRRVEPKRLGTLVRGELDWIVMKALEKDRARRYETANGLAQDIRRYLGGEAVVAAPPSAAYRVRKFVRRNKATVVAGCAVAAALLIGLVGFAWQASVAQRERDVAVEAKDSEAVARKLAQLSSESESRQRTIAESNAREAAAINEFLLGMLGSADVHALGREVKVAQALDHAAATVGTAFEGQPEVETAVRQILGNTYRSIGMLDQAEPHLVAAVELERTLHGEASDAFARSLGALGTLKQMRGDYTAAEELRRRACSIAAAASGAESALTLGLRADYANTLVSLGRESEAETLLRETLATRTRLYGRESGDAQVMINSLAVLLHNLRRFDEAEALYREAVELGARTRGDEHPDTLTARVNLASLLRSRGKLAEAERLMLAAYTGVKQVFGDAHKQTAGAAWALAGLYNQQGRYKDALPLFEECVAIRRRAEGEHTLAVAEAKQSLAYTLARMGERVRAVQIHRELVDARLALGDPESRDVLMARVDLANALVLTTETRDEGEALFETLLEECPRILGEDDTTTIIATNSFAVFLLGRERHADAEPYLRKALETGRRVEGPDAQNTIITQCNMVGCLRELGRLDEAEELGRDTLERFERVFGKEHGSTASAHSVYGETLLRLGRTDEAKREFLAALAIKRAAFGEENPAFVGDAIALGRLWLDAGDVDEAEPLLRRAVEVGLKARGPKDLRTANARVELGRCLGLRAHFAEAEPLLVDGHEALVATRPAGSKDILRAERYLAEFFAAWNAAEPDAGRAAQAAEWRAKVDTSR